ncbi:MAG: methyl-branched lipid omega-hydroxylase [Thermoleophilaceae bacterium]|jgi:cytochrome P450|nr:methyl-branched lipid omega-hydroxylase [Thermoleophilaceae bacterium]
MSVETRPVAADVLDPELWLQENDDERERVFAHLRAEAPVSWQEDREFLGMAPGPGFWSIVKHGDIRAISRDAETFSAAGAMQYFDWPPEVASFYDSIVEIDPPRHTQWRKIIAPAFTASKVRAWDERIRRICREVIAEAAPLGECDFPKHFAEQVPLRITAEMMGIPESYWDDVIEYTHSYLHCYDREVLPEGVESIKKACTELAAMAHELAEFRRREPGEDLTSMLANAEIQDEEGGPTRPLSDDEYASFWLTMVTGGTETTRMTLNHGMELLTHHPDQRERWRNDLSLSRPAVEEMIRWTTPQGYFRRVANRDVVVNGTEIKKDDRMVLWYHSGNRDEDVFERPFEFDITRDPNPHVAFGGGGPHFCIGLGIARMEIADFFEELFQLLPDIETTGPMVRVHSFYMPEAKSMPCAFTPRTISLDD